MWGLDEGGMLATGTISDMEEEEEEEEEETLLSTLSLWWGWAVLLLVQGLADTPGDQLQTAGISYKPRCQKVCKILV